MFELIGALGFFGVFILILLGVIMPISVYAAQKWAYRCFKELREMNERLERLEHRPPELRPRQHREPGDWRRERLSTSREEGETNP